MTGIMVWMLIVLAPHAEPKIMGGFTQEDECKQAVEAFAELAKKTHSIAVCTAYVPRDQA